MSANQYHLSGNKTVVMITTPLEREFAERIAAVDPERVQLIYRPDLMPPARYIADHNGDPAWRRSAEQQQEWLALLAGAEVLWDFATVDGRGVFELSPGLRWVQTSSAGVGQLVTRLGAVDSDLIVTTASGVHAEPLAEFVLGVLLYHEGRFALIEKQQREHLWERFCGGEIAGKTMAIVGPGRIGREIARVARAFGIRPLALARDSRPERAVELGVDRLYPREELHDLLALADYVVLCTPHTPETEDLIGSAEIAAMKPGVVLVNIARGVVIDEAAMIDALRSGQIAFAGLDVFRTEPLPANSPLWDLPNVLINPHSASTAESENAKITALFCRNLRAFLNGAVDQMTPVLDKRRMY